MELTNIAANIGAALTTLLGLLGLLAPNKAALMVGIQPIGRNGTSEIRATYGGLFIAMGLTCLISQIDKVFVCAGIAWGGAALGRLWSVIIDHNWNSKNWAGIALESTIGFLLLAPILHNT